MKKFEEIGKVMPFKETDQNVDAFIDQITINTIISADSRQEKKTQILKFFTSMAAAVVLFAIGSLKFINNKPSTYDAVMNSESVAELLNDMGDEAVESEVYYTQNAMPDYYY